MRLKEGQPAPSFSVADLHGEQHALSDYSGKKLLLSFYRYASCPFCNLRVHELLSHVDAWRERGLSLMAVFQSPAASVAEYVGKQAAPFPILCDPDRALYAQYAVENSWLGFAAGLVRPRGVVAMAKGFLPGRMEGVKSTLPADFFIGPDGAIRAAYYSDNIVDHLPIAEIDRLLEQS